MKNNSQYFEGFSIIGVTTTNDIRSHRGNLIAKKGRLGYTYDVKKVVNKEIDYVLVRFNGNKVGRSVPAWENLEPIRLCTPIKKIAGGWRQLWCKKCNKKITYGQYQNCGGARYVLANFVEEWKKHIKETMNIDLDDFQARRIVEWAWEGSPEFAYTSSCKEIVGVKDI